MNRNSMRLRCVATLMLALAGCGGRKVSDYTPNEARAKDAVIVALEAWKKSQPSDPAGKLPSGAVVRGIDTDWNAGAKLATYEIGSEVATGGEGPRKIAVKLTHATGGPIDAVYFVVGIDPVHVFRDKDYERSFGAYP